MTGWGRYPDLETELVEPRRLGEVRGAFAEADGVIARGNGRAYGDAAIGVRRTVSIRQLDRMRSFDPETGRITVEAGTLLGDVIAAVLPRGHFPMVVPGTRHVSVGGAIAADIHGKNHHRDGGFGASVERMTLLLPDGSTVETSPTLEPGLFRATVGGMGLTGAILEATIRLKPVESGWIRQRTLPAADLSSVMRALDAGDEATYSVAWIDTLASGRNLGRSLVFLGEHARADELGPKEAERYPALAGPRLSVPLDFPSFTLNRLSVGVFNRIYHRVNARREGAPFTVPAGPYFFPLDGVGAWNRIYGRRGFVQHQCVLPPETAESALGEILERVARRGSSSFLAVLKKLGPSWGMLSFPKPGFTLALDFPVTDDLASFLAGLDEIVVEAGGRLYLAKDSQQSRATFEAGYPDLDGFRSIRRRLDPDRRLRSHLADRLGL
nr:FAD-binding oxidoreductase [Chthonobacter rhizosphaerae]